MGLFNRLIYGNPNKPDLEVDENVNPIKGFFDVLTIKIGDLVKLNLIFAVFVLPTAIWVSINISALINQDLSIELLDSIGFMFFLGLIPCLIIMGIGLPSLNYITKSYAKEFHVWMFEDFLEKIKENWKQSLLYSLLLGVMIFLCYFGIRFYTMSIGNIPGAQVLRAILFIMTLIVLFSTVYIYPLMVTFELKMKHLLKNSVVLTIARLPQTILILFLTLIFPIFFIFLTFAWSYGIIALVAYFLIFGFSFSAFIINAYTNQVFEKFIIAKGNKHADKKLETEREEKK